MRAAGIAVNVDAYVASTSGTGLVTTPGAQDPLCNGVPAPLCLHGAVSRKGSLHKHICPRLLCHTPFLLELIFKTASASGASCSRQPVLQLCRHELDLLCSAMRGGGVRTAGPGIESD